MKVLVTGSRRTGTPQVVYDALQALRPAHVLTGGAKGADHYAEAWCNREIIYCQIFRPDWNRYGRKAGPIRNQQMVDEKPDLVLAFLIRGEENRGTLDTMRRADKAGIPIQAHEVWEDPIIQAALLEGRRQREQKAT